MKVARTIQSVRRTVQAARSHGKKIGLVPTMGALHIGHIELLRAAAKKSDFIVVSIFVNPTQFGPKEDFRKYPRPFKRDLDICREYGVDLVFAPTNLEMYGWENLTWVTVEKLTAPLCGNFRPGHFRGVSTVCAKLFNVIQPDVAFFGQKDAQQTTVIKRMVADLKMPLKIVVCPTVREPDGLAVSSRNKYLTAQQRKDAAAIYKSLGKCRELVKASVTDPKKITAEMRKILRQRPSIKIEYAEIVDAETLEPLDSIRGKILAAVAVRLGPTRLIDNVLIQVPGTNRPSRTRRR
jgi:pantoate--beta-alanine ligase